MDADRRRELASSFGTAAELYDRIRPRYPVEAIQWALAPLGRGVWRVADVGAGTGILTRVLLAFGHEVVAVEPDDQMRRLLESSTAGALALAGRAESLPLPDGSVDAALAGQAYHWFDRREAHAELARVVRPGGVFAAIWNDRDESCPWVREFCRIVEGDLGPDGLGANRSRHPDSFGPGFGPVEVAEFRHSVWHTADMLVDLTKSRSFFITATPDRQAAFEAEVRALAATHPDLAGRESFPLPYVTRVYRAQRTA